MTPTSSPLDSRLFPQHSTFIAERPADADEDVHMVASIVDHVIERCSARGDLVFDPFAGFGTTLERAITLGREALGIELLPERVHLIRSRLPDADVIEGDARDLWRLLDRHRSPEASASAQLVLTSPPYMTATHHDADPLLAYEQDGGDYTRYLAELGLVAAQCARVVKPGGYVVWNVADILHRGQTTHLIRDCGMVLARYLLPVGITKIMWDTYPHDLVADALLVLQRAH